IRLGPEDAEIKYCLTLPPFRGRGLFPRVLKSMVKYLTAKGFCRIFICVHEDNLPSIRGIEKAGFKLVERIRLRKKMGIQVSGKYTPPEV
ncbi:MAG: GNAT family N-acetyltransferase, partial [Deltaproteobacteria bacterium]|nr:GNAT family N-acetyltransferase [Deltaproteobacteria bacterium]